MSRPKIICIDDESTVLDSLRSLLDRTFADSVRVDCFDNSKKAFEYLDKQEDKDAPILFIVDEVMPGQRQGSKVLVSVNKKYPNAKKILLTGKADHGDIGFAIKEAKIDEYIEKPWDESNLITKVKELLGLIKDEIVEAFKDLIDHDPDADKPFIVTADGRKYSLKDLYKEIKNKTPFGLTYKKSIIETIINYMNKQKVTNLNELNKIESKYIRG